MIKKLPVYLRIQLFKLVFFAQRCVVCQTSRLHTVCMEFVRSLLALMPINCCLHDESLLPALVQRCALELHFAYPSVASDILLSVYLCQTASATI